MSLGRGGQPVLAGVQAYCHPNRRLARLATTGADRGGEGADTKVANKLTFQPFEIIFLLRVDES